MDRNFDDTIYTLYSPDSTNRAELDKYISSTMLKS